MIRRLLACLRENREWHRQWKSSWPPVMTPDSQGVTPFQRTCMAELAKALPKVHELTWNGENHEPYFTSVVPGTSLKCWIYECDAEISGPGVELHFEAGAYAQPGQLVADLLKALQTHLQVPA